MRPRTSRRRGDLGLRLASAEQRRAGRRGPIHGPAAVHPVDRPVCTRCRPTSTSPVARTSGWRWALPKRWLPTERDLKTGGWTVRTTLGPRCGRWYAATGSHGADTSFLGYAGGNHTFGGVASSTISATSLIITIDTTAADWNVTWDFNSDGVDRTETVLAADVPNINYVGFSSTDTAGTATITSFLLDGPAPPTNVWNVDGGGSFNTAGNWLDNVGADHGRPLRQRADRAQRAGLGHA